MPDQSQNQGAPVPTPVLSGGREWVHLWKDYGHSPRARRFMLNAQDSGMSPLDAETQMLAKTRHDVSAQQELGFDGPTAELRLKGLLGNVPTKLGGDQDTGFVRGVQDTLGTLDKASAKVPGVQPFANVLTDLSAKGGYVKGRAQNSAGPVGALTSGALQAGKEAIEPVVQATIYPDWSQGTNPARQENADRDAREMLDAATFGNARISSPEEDQSFAQASPLYRLGVTSPAMAAQMLGYEATGLPAAIDAAIGKGALPIVRSLAHALGGGAVFTAAGGLHGQNWQEKGQNYLRDLAANSAIPLAFEGAGTLMSELPGMPRDIMSWLYPHTEGGSGGPGPDFGSGSGAAPMVDPMSRMRNGGGSGRPVMGYPKNWEPGLFEDSGAFNAEKIWQNPVAGGIDLPPSGPEGSNSGSHSDTVFFRNGRPVYPFGADAPPEAAPAGKVRFPELEARMEEARRAFKDRGKVPPNADQLSDADWEEIRRKMPWVPKRESLVVGDIALDEPLNDFNRREYHDTENPDPAPFWKRMLNRRKVLLSEYPNEANPVYRAGVLDEDQPTFGRVTAILRDMNPGEASQQFNPDMAAKIQSRDPAEMANIESYDRNVLGDKIVGNRQGGPNDRLGRQLDPRLMEKRLRQETAQVSAASDRARNVNPRGEPDPQLLAEIAHNIPKPEKLDPQDVVGAPSKGSGKLYSNPIGALMEGMNKAGKWGIDKVGDFVQGKEARAARIQKVALRNDLVNQFQGALNKVRENVKGQFKELQASNLPLEARHDVLDKSYQKQVEVVVKTYQKMARKAGIGHKEFEAYANTGRLWADSQSKIARAGNKFINFRKVSNMVLTPKAWMGEAALEVYSHLGAGVNPLTWPKAAKNLIDFTSGKLAKLDPKMNARVQEAFDNGLSGSSFFHVSSANPHIKKLFYQMKIGEGGAQAGFWHLAKFTDAVFSGGMNGYDFMLESARLHAYNHFRDLGMEPHMAVREVDKFYQNYNKPAFGAGLQGLENNILVKLLANPSFKFPMNVLRITKNLALEKPANLLAMMTGLAVAQRMGLASAEKTGKPLTARDKTKFLATTDSGKVYDYGYLVPFLGMFAGYDKDPADNRAGDISKMVSKAAGDLFDNGSLKDLTENHPGLDMGDAATLFAADPSIKHFSMMANTPTGRAMSPFPTGNRILDALSIKRGEENRDIPAAVRGAFGFSEVARDQKLKGAMAPINELKRLDAGDKHKATMYFDQLAEPNLSDEDRQILVQKYLDRVSRRNENANP